MNITFNKTEILAALAAHVAATGISLRGKEVTLADDSDLAIEVSIDDANTKVRKTRKTRTPKAPPSETETDTEDASKEAESTTDDVADEMEGKAPAKKTTTRKKAAPKAPAKKKRMFGAAKK